MPTPQGSVVALSSASATVFSVGIVFLGYWGVHEPAPWNGRDIVIACCALAGFACLGCVPWIATRPVAPDRADDGIKVARWLFLAGVGAVWLAVAVSAIF